jgi:hypothetical protein
MKTLLIAAGLALASQGASALMCFKSGEQMSGMNKICYYRCPTGNAAITVQSYELCPLTIDQKSPGQPGPVAQVKPLPFALSKRAT